jgi:WD40-like Beta Propeller Repeat
MSDPPDQLYWVRPSLLLYGNDFGIGAITVGQSPKLLGKKPPEPFSVGPNGDRVAAGAVSSCTHTGCAGPVKILSVPWGALVGTVGGTQRINTEPSLSPDGTQVVFARFAANDSGRRLGIWTASADGSHLLRLTRGGSNPLWSPVGNRIAYLARTHPSALRLVPSQGVRARHSCAKASVPSSPGRPTAGTSRSRIRRGALPSSTPPRRKCGSC